MGEMIIRKAKAADAPAISDVLVRSIKALCAADHLDDPELIAGWIANKSPYEIGLRLSAGTNMLVTEVTGKVAAVGEFQSNGHIDLLYVAPEMRGKGHSSALLRAMERKLIELGVERARLVSSKTAQSFYAKHGWEVQGDRVTCYTTDGQPMCKALVSS